MRSVKVRDLTDANARDDGIQVVRRKGSHANVTR
jgi:predicted RNA binding protein YcfA (HicA-like mRNA interferase family)